MDNVIMYSGGIDSFLVHQWMVGNKIDHELIYFNLGTKYSNNEINLFNTENFLKYVKQNVTISDCLHMGSLEQEDAHVPNRNLLTSIMAQSVTGYNNIWVGGTKSDRTGDNNSECFRKLSELLTIVNNKNIVVNSPFWAYHKPELVKLYIQGHGWGLCENENDARDSLVTSTFSCYYPNEEKKISITYKDFTKNIYKNDITNKDIITTECLECKACFRKCMSLYAGGIKIPMLKTENSIRIVHDYFEEANEGIQRDDDMKLRFYYTIKYCNYLKKMWGPNNVC